MAMAGLDSSGFIDGPNLYAYVGGSPVGAVDPTGMFTLSVGVNANAVLGGVIGGELGLYVTSDNGLGEWEAGRYETRRGLLGAELDRRTFVRAKSMLRRTIMQAVPPMESKNLSNFGIYAIGALFGILECLGWAVILSTSLSSNFKLAIFLLMAICFFGIPMQYIRKNKERTDLIGSQVLLNSRKFGFFCAGSFTSIVIILIFLE